MKFSVIGGSGFIGTSLCKKLEIEKIEFDILDKTQSLYFPSKTKFADVRSPNDLDETLSEKSVIINLAAEHQDDVRPNSLYYDVNVEGAKNICRVATAKHIAKIIFTSSVAVYGFPEHDADETCPINPFNDYGKSKYEAEEVFRIWQLEDPEKRSLIIIRPTVVFGPGNRGNVYNLFKQISSRRFVMLGSGENRKSLAYVENISSFIIFLLRNSTPGVKIYNYADKPDFTMNQLVKVVQRALGFEKFKCLRMPYCFGFAVGSLLDFISFLTHRKFSISAIRIKKFCSNSIYQTKTSEVGFTPPYRLTQAIEYTIFSEFIER
jgi:nucleoside-diphosphate-sugar epimerase